MIIISNCPMPRKIYLDSKPRESFFRELVDEEREQDWLIFRFLDLKERAQVKLCVKLKGRGTCQSVCKLDIKHIYHALRVTNPIIIENFSGGWHSGQMPRWREQYLSRVVYHMCCRKPSDAVKQTLVDLIETPHRCTLQRISQERINEQLLNYNNLFNIPTTICPTNVLTAKQR